MPDVSKEPQRHILSASCGVHNAAIGSGSGAGMATSAESRLITVL